MNKLFILLICLLCIQAKGQPSTKIGETNRFEFYCNYWLNLHHFLQLEALLDEAKDSSLLSSGLKSQLSQEEKQSLEHAVTYYQQNLSEEDLRTSDYQRAFRQWIISQTSMKLDLPPASFQPHIDKLKSVSTIYKEHLWPIHRTAINNAFELYKSLIIGEEDTIASQLALLTRAYWQEEKIRVDICYYAKSTSWNLRNRPYTSLEPTHIVMNVDGELVAAKGNWMELLFHEASHHLIGTRTGFVAGTIMDVCRVKEREIPRGLWHAYLFYFSGKVVQESLAGQGISDYVLYMERNKVFRRYYPLLNTFMPAYLSGEKSLQEVSAEIINALK